MQTLNQHIKIFSDFANSHLQIQSFGVGDLWELVESYNNPDESQESNRNYPVMWVTIDGASTTENQHIHSFSVVFADRVDRDEKNEQEVLSDTELLWLDFLAYVKQNTTPAINIDTVFVKSSNASPFTERWQDDVAGWACTVQFKQDFQYNKCDIPLT